MDIKRKPRPTAKGRQPDPNALVQVRAVLADAARDPALLIEFLHRLQDAYHRLSAEHLAALAQELRLSQAEVFEAATFYHHFDVVKDAGAEPPRFTIRVCGGLSCRMAGAAELLERLQARYDWPVRVQAVPCIGRCDQAPAVCVGQHAFGHATLDNVSAAADAGQLAAPDAVAAPDAQAYAVLRDCLAGKWQPQQAIEALEQSGLRGMGGAGFPTGRKWRIVAAEPASRLLAVNLDEGEPGTFKDRWILESDPHCLLEGALIAAWAVQAEAVYLYLRDEYHALRAMLERELAALPARLGSDYAANRQAMPALHLRRGAGAYVCGEESAMLESIEGKRGMPRLRPPYVAQRGLFGRPTLVQNGETLAWVPLILRDGDAAFAGHGRNGRRGLRAFSVSGRVQQPGVHLAPAGITLNQLIAEYCGGMLPGHDLYGYLPGGASGGILPASLADLPLDFDTLQPYGCFIGSAAIVVLSQHDRARDAALNALEFFRDESCGQCTPCRAGTEKAVHLLRAPAWNKPLLDDLAQVMQDASICGLGQAAPNPFLSVLKYFPHEVE